MLSAAALSGLLPLGQQQQQIFGASPNNIINNIGNNNSLLTAVGGSGANLSSTTQLFGRFPIQPLGPGTGSLTSGNSDAAAAAQLQQQAHLLNALQQQQNALSSVLF